MKKKNILLVLLLLFGFSVIIYHEKIVEGIDQLLSGKDQRQTIAVIQTLDGRVRVKPANTLRYKNANVRQELKDKDTLTTDADSHVKLSFVSGFEIQVEPNSLIVIENPKQDADGRIQITFLKGEFTVLKTGSPNQVIVSKDKKFQDLAGRTPQKPVEIDLTPTNLIPDRVEDIKVPVLEAVKLDEKKKVLAEKKAPPPPPKKPKETLSDDYISQVVLSQKPFFNRCYAQHLRLNPDSRGQIHLAFTINTQGRVSSVSLVQSSLSDPQLEKCTMSVVERCRFKAFDGDPIVVNYPINFE